jgi:glycerophosphoryl diester phosphodiesterase
MTPFDEPGAVPPSWLVDLPLAHRGLHDDAVPENSLAAFAAAAELGYGVELDVHVTADGQPVVIHDASLARVAGDGRKVGDLGAEELDRLRLLDTDERVPTLREALEVLRDVPVMVEVKSGRLRPGPLERGIAQVLDDHPGEACVASFNPYTLRWFRRHRPETVRVLTATAERIAGVPRLLLRRLSDLRDVPSVAPAAVSYDILGLPRPAVTSWRERGGAVVTWTVDDQDTWERAKRFADNIIFENVRPEVGASTPTTENEPTT